MPDQWNAFVVGPRGLSSGPTSGHLGGLTFAVKDVIDVAGIPTSLGLPEPGPIAPRSASTVQRLVDSGALIAGKTATDQLALGLSGQDTASPIPINPLRPRALVGGSSSGSAAAVAAGLVSFALATDTAGSVRVPASYCGLVGFRSTHHAIDMDGVVPLAPRFDTIGWLASDGATARAVGEVLLPPRPTPAPVSGVLVLDDLLAELDESVADSVRVHSTALAADWGLPVIHDNLGVPLLSLGSDFRKLQLADIAKHENRTISDALLLPGVLRRRVAARETLAGDISAGASAQLERLSAHLSRGALLVLPAAAGPAPDVATVMSGAYESHREMTIALNAVAALLGAPSIVMPSPRDSLGTAVVAAPGSDLQLLALAERATPRVTPSVLDELRHMFYRYEAALLDEDLDLLGSFFGAGPGVTRFSPEGAAYGWDAIQSSRAARPPGTSAREIDRLQIALLNESTAVTTVEFTRSRTGVHGFQTQTWHRERGRWLIQLAHVSLAASAQGSPTGTTAHRTPTPIPHTGGKS